jgi:N-methylhydantoinase A
VATVGIRLDRGDCRALEAAFRRLEDEARAILSASGVPLGAATFQRLADGRFLGQGFDLVVTLPAGPYDGSDVEATQASLREAFEAAYREKFALTPPSVPVEFINVRIAARAPVAGGAIGLDGRAGTMRGRAVKGQRPAYFRAAGGFVETTVYDRSRLVVGEEFEGPAVVEEEGSTLVVGPGAHVRVAPTGNLVVSLPPR